MCRRLKVEGNDKKKKKKLKTDKSIVPYILVSSNIMPAQNLGERETCEMNIGTNPGALPPMLA